MQDPNIFGCKIFRESMFWGLNFTLHTHTPVYKYRKYPPPPPWLDSHDWRILSRILKFVEFSSFKHEIVIPMFCNTQIETKKSKGTLVNLLML